MVRIALLGLGGFGRRLAQQLLEQPTATLEAVFDVDTDALEAAVDEFGVEEDACYTDESKLYAERDVDAVVIAPPPAFHHRQISGAADRGLHVLCEKPVAVDLEPAAVAAEMTFYDEGREIDQEATLSIRFENGTLASMSDTATAPTARERIRIWDDDGALALTSRDWGRPSLTAIDADGTETECAVDRGEGIGKVEAFVEAIESGTEPPATVEDVVRVTALLDAAYESARTGERVAVDLE